MSFIINLTTALGSAQSSPVVLNYNTIMHYTTTIVEHSVAISSYNVSINYYHFNLDPTDLSIGSSNVIVARNIETSLVTRDLVISAITGSLNFKQKMNELPYTDFCYAKNVTLLDGRILSIGGMRSARSVPSNEVYIIEPKTGVAVDVYKVTPFPVTTSMITSSAEVLSDGRVFVFSGANAYAGTVNGYTITWEAITPHPNSCTSIGLTVLSDGRLLSIGGYNGAYTNYSYLGTISGNTITWVATTGFTYPVLASQYLGATESGNNFVMLGGITTGESIVGNMYVGSVSGNTLTNTTYANQPLTCSHADGAYIGNNKFVLFGGFHVGWGANSIINEVKILPENVGQPYYILELNSKQVLGTPSDGILSTTRLNDGRLFTSGGYFFTPSRILSLTGTGAALDATVSYTTKFVGVSSEINILNISSNNTGLLLGRIFSITSSDYIFTGNDLQVLANSISLPAIVGDYVLTLSNINHTVLHAYTTYVDTSTFIFSGNISISRTYIIIEDTKDIAVYSSDVLALKGSRIVLDEEIISLSSSDLILLNGLVEVEMVVDITITGNDLTLLYCRVLPVIASNIVISDTIVLWYADKRVLLQYDTFSLSTSELATVKGYSLSAITCDLHLESINVVLNIHLYDGNTIVAITTASYAVTANTMLSLNQIVLICIGGIFSVSNHGVTLLNNGGLLLDNSSIVVSTSDTVFIQATRTLKVDTTSFIISGQFTSIQVHNTIQYSMSMVKSDLSLIRYDTLLFHNYKISTVTDDIIIISSNLGIREPVRIGVVANDIVIESGLLFVSRVITLDSSSLSSSYSAISSYVAYTRTLSIDSLSISSNPITIREPVRITLSSDSLSSTSYVLGIHKGYTYIIGEVGTSVYTYDLSWYKHYTVTVVSSVNSVTSNSTIVARGLRYSCVITPYVSEVYAAIRLVDKTPLVTTTNSIVLSAYPLAIRKVFYRAVDTDGLLITCNSSTITKNSTVLADVSSVNISSSSMFVNRRIELVSFNLSLLSTDAIVDNTVHTTIDMPTIPVAITTYLLRTKVYIPAIGITSTTNSFKIAGNKSYFVS